VIEVLAYAKKPVGAVMMRPLLRRFTLDPRFAVRGAAKWFGDDAGARVFTAAGVEQIAPLPVWRARFKRFDVYLSADFGVVAPRSRIKVHLFHGVSFRNHAVHQNALRYDLLLLAGPYMRRQFEQRGILTAANAERFVTVGMPKLDALVDGSLRRDDVLTRLALDPALPTVLYAPTWSKKMSSLIHHGEALARELARFSGNVIVKLHDNSLDPRKAKRDWRALFATLESPRFRFVDAADVVPLLAAADVLVSDASSVANEFALLDRPIVFLDIERLEEKVKDKADLDTWGRRSGDVIDGPAALLPALDAALADPKRHSDVRRALAADIFHEPGRATEHAWNAILRALTAKGLLA
jgi:hypothetical protein